MEIIYYKDPKGNFGDDLNGWLWPKIFSNCGINDGTAFLGIGSILFNNHKIVEDLGLKRKVVFGTGIRPMYDYFQYDSSWDIKFLRGPLSSNALDNKFKYITDAAYALRLVEDFSFLKSLPKVHEISIMPYFKSVDVVNWPRICAELGFHYISPLSENGVHQTLTEIAQSKFLITEAMHGAILADALRVPWSRYVLTTPYTEGSMVSEFKWMDWLLSVGLNRVNTTFIKYHRKTVINSVLRKVSMNALNVEFFVKPVVEREIIQKLKLGVEYYLSSEIKIEENDSKLAEEVFSLRKQLMDVID
jgi:succinoglycan biosynthesis protein ExoV